MKTRKTYAARGLLDWQLALNVGGAIIKICFTGGSMGSNGVLPAKYTTDNPAIQEMIENSRHFNTRVFVYECVTLKDDKDTAPENKDRGIEIPEKKDGKSKR